MAGDGSSIVRISAEKPGWGTASPRWAPDGQRVLYVAHTENKSEFHMVSAAGEKRTRVPVPSHITSVAGLCWGPDGTIVFAGGTAEGSYDIYLMKPGDGEAAIRRIVGNGIQPAWSPDGRLLAFTTFRDGNLEVYVADSDGGNLRNLTRHEGHDARPAWVAGRPHRLRERPLRQSRDLPRRGSRRGGGQPQQSPWTGSGTGVRRLTAQYVTDREPAWSPDGGSLCFVSNRPQPFLDRLRRWFSGRRTDW